MDGKCISGCNFKYDGAISAWLQSLADDTNMMAHRQLKANLSNLSYVFTEVKCHYKCSSLSAELNKEYTLLVPDTNLYDIMLLGAKYKQKAIINKDGSTINIMDTDVGRILASIKYDGGDIKYWVMIYAEYIRCKYGMDSKIEIVSLEKLHIPMRTESLLRSKEKEGLAATRWVSLF